MKTAEKIALIEETLTRAAEQIGDVTAPTMEAYYRRYPEAEASFKAHCLGERGQLEGQMVENSLHCLMHWVGSPGEIEILLGSSVLHHNDTLSVSPDWYSGLIEATAEIIADTIPADHAEELAVWNELRRDLRGVIEDCRKVIAQQNLR